MKNILYLFLAVTLFSCSSDSEGNPCVYEPTLTTEAATDITETSATLNGVISIVSENCDVPNNTEQGFVYSTEIQPTLEDIKVNVNGTNISTTIEGLESNTTYYVRAFLTNTLGDFYGIEISFITQDDNVISLSGRWDIVSGFDSNGEPQDLEETCAIENYFVCDDNSGTIFFHFNEDADGAIIDCYQSNSDDFSYINSPAGSTQFVFTYESGVQLIAELSDDSNDIVITNDGYVSTFRINYQNNICSNLVGEWFAVIPDPEIEGVTGESTLVLNSDFSGMYEVIWSTGVSYTDTLTWSCTSTMLTAISSDGESDVYEYVIENETLTLTQDDYVNSYERIN